MTDRVAKASVEAVIRDLEAQAREHAGLAQQKREAADTLRDAYGLTTAPAAAPPPMTPAPPSSTKADVAAIEQSIMKFLHQAALRAEQVTAAILAKATKPKPDRGRYRKALKNLIREKRVLVSNPERRAGAIYRFGESL